MPLIGTADIAAMLNLAQRYVTNKVTKRVDFPPPALRLSQKTVKWERADVERWIARQRVLATKWSAGTHRRGGY